MPQERIELHGWDSRSRAWHGPDELAFRLDRNRHILGRLRELQGSWHGRIREAAPGALPVTFCATVHDLGDAGVATIDWDGSPGGPVEIIMVLPAQRRKTARPELAFEFTSYLRFLEGRVGSGSELPIYEHVEQLLRDSDPASTLVISVEMRFIAPEVHEMIAEAAERLTMSMIAWMAEKDAMVPSSSVAE